MAQQKWLPLESNPDVMSKFLHSLGVPEQFQIVDVLGFDDALLEMVPQPVYAVILLFPTSENYKNHCLNIAEKLKSSNQTISDKVYYVKQTISNACGTIALIHSVANNIDTIKLKESSSLANFFAKTASLSPDERAAILEKENVIESVHSDLAQEGQTSAPPMDAAIDLHFIAFVQVENNLYELDGSKPGPLNHGTSSAGTLLKDAAKICQEYMARDPNEMRFTVVALTAA